jgi:hypothetical protein
MEWGETRDLTLVSAGHEMNMYIRWMDGWVDGHAIYSYTKRNVALGRKCR